MRLHDLLKALDVALVEVEGSPQDVTTLSKYRAILKALATELTPITPPETWGQWVLLLDKIEKAIISRKTRWLQWARNALWILHRSMVLLMQDYGLLYKLKKKRTLSDDTKVLENYIKAEVGQ